MLGTESLDQLFLFFRNYPALQDDFELEWAHKINYRHKHQLKPITTPHCSNKNQNHTSPETIHNSVSATIIDHPIDFGIFHRKVYTLIDHWAHQPIKQNEEGWTIWNKWTWKGLKPNSTFAEIMKIMDINSLQGYVKKMNIFPCFISHVQLVWDENNVKF